MHFDNHKGGVNVVLFAPLRVVVKNYIPSLEVRKLMFYRIYNTKDHEPEEYPEVIRIAHYQIQNGVYVSLLPLVESFSETK